MRDLTHQLAETSKSLTEIRNKIAIHESNTADRAATDEEREVLQALLDEADDLEALVLDLDEEIREVVNAKYNSKYEYE